MFLSQFNTLASEVKCLRVIERRDLSNEAEYLQKQDDILSQENKAKARARYKADPEKKKASVRDSYKADPEKKKASVRDSYKADPEKRRPLYATATTQILNLSNLLKGSDITRGEPCC